MVTLKWIIGLHVDGTWNRVRKIQQCYRDGSELRVALSESKYTHFFLRFSLLNVISVNRNKSSLIYGVAFNAAH